MYFHLEVGDDFFPSWVSFGCNPVSGTFSDTFLLLTVSLFGPAILLTYSLTIVSSE